MIIMGCVSRSANPFIEVTANQQQTGSHTENLIDVQNTHVITFKILNNETSTAKNVKIDYSYCNNNQVLQYCQKGSIDNIGDLLPYQSIIRYVTYNRSAYSDFSSIEKFQLRYNAESEY